MSDDLIKRLRAGEHWPKTSADRIEQLERERKQNGEDYCALMEKHDALHVKLAKAVEALRYYAVEAMPWEADDSLVARTTLAELEANP